MKYEHTFGAASPQKVVPRRNSLYFSQITIENPIENCWGPLFGQGRAEDVFVLQGF